MSIFTEQDANYILSLLSELPIKYLPLVQQVQVFLSQKLQKEPNASDIEYTTDGFKTSTTESRYFNNES